MPVVLGQTTQDFWNCKLSTIDNDSWKLRRQVEEPHTRSSAGMENAPGDTETSLSPQVGMLLVGLRYTGGTKQKEVPPAQGWGSPAWGGVWGC